MSKEGPIFVFVYGTLKRNGCNHPLLATATFVGEAAVDGFQLYDLKHFPAAQPMPGRRVRGELFQVSTQTFRALDRLEGYPHDYDRMIVKAGEHLAWIYFQDRPHGQPMKEDIWTPR